MSKDCSPSSPATQATFLEAALALDPDTIARELALWDVRTAQGNHAAALAAVTGDRRRRRRSRGAAQFLTGVSLMALKQVRRGVRDASRQLHDAAPDAADPEQSRRRAAPPRLARPRPASPCTTSRKRRSGARRPRPAVQSRLRLRARSRSAGGDLLAARGGAAQSRRRRRAFRAGGGARRRRNDGRSERERELAAPALAQDMPRRPTATPLPRGLERVAAATSRTAARRRRRSGDRQRRAARPARSSRSSISIAAAGCSSAEQDREAMLRTAPRRVPLAVRSARRIC